MPIKVELTEPKYLNLGHISSENQFINKTLEGNDEILVFKKGESSTVVYLLDPDVKRFQKLAVLKEGGKSLTREVGHTDGRSKKLRFSHVNKIPPIIVRRKLN